MQVHLDDMRKHKFQARDVAKLAAPGRLQSRDVSNLAVLHGGAGSPLEPEYVGRREKKNRMFTVTQVVMFAMLDDFRLEGFGYERGMQLTNIITKKRWEDFGDADFVELVAIHDRNWALLTQGVFPLTSSAFIDFRSGREFMEKYREALDKKPRLIENSELYCPLPMFVYAGGVAVLETLKRVSEWIKE